MLERRQQEEQLSIRAGEIVPLVSRWGTYRGEKITEDRVRAWLAQFGDAGEQRLMFRILENLKFYNFSQIRDKMREAHDIVTRHTTRKFEQRKRKRADIIISYLDGPAKSGAHYARVYADENQIYADNVVERSQICARLAQLEDCQALVFIDDVIGSGRSGGDYLARLQGDCGEVLTNRAIRMCFVAICGVEDGRAAVEHRAEELGMNVTVHLCEPLDESSRCFSDKSSVFPDPIERGRARELARRFGGRLVKNNPLGYAGGELMVVFESNCPNNTLPILWADGPDWVPLFRRV